MPELPEVETIVNDLNKTIPGQKIGDVWCDAKKTIRLCLNRGEETKKPGNFKRFKKEIQGKKIKKVWRRGKNIIFDLSGDFSLLVHLKLTGHFLVGHWTLDKGYWKSKNKGFLEEKVNSYIHLLFFLDDGRMLALSDMRKFAKAELWKKKELNKKLGLLGPEPLEKEFTFKKLQELFKKKKGKIKSVLMDQKTIVGIGNIYSDEILWETKINPLKNVSELTPIEIKKIYLAIKKILKKAVKLRGTSFSDFRDITGRPGSFKEVRKAYRREGEKCERCDTIIKRIKIGGRSSCFCPKCQKQ